MPELPSPLRQPFKSSVHRDVEAQQPSEYLKDIRRGEQKGFCCKAMRAGNERETWTKKVLADIHTSEYRKREERDDDNTDYPDI
jgi:hypothetical protein